MARTSSSSARKTPAAKKTASKTTAKKTTSRPRTTRNTPAKTAPATPRLSLVKPPTTTGLPRRNSDYVTDAQIYAHHTARLAGLPTHLIRDWADQRNGTAIRRLTDGSYLHYQHDTRTLTWLARCPMGAPHAYRITNPSTVAAARIHAARCQTPHADLTHIQPLTRDELEALGIHTGPTWARPDLLDETPTETIPVPLPDRKPRALGDQLTRTQADTTDTQPLSHDEIAAGLAARAAQDTPKEHPQP
ncbi:hypothetical protein [Streptomyces pilosus]|uniref:hypothetical protein n=1 Tax=Streptomyces pilosus TaxID=28893 RepID=UPI00362ED752